MGLFVPSRDGRDTWSRHLPTHLPHHHHSSAAPVQCHPRKWYESFPFTMLKNAQCRASLVAQWLRICLRMQGTRVRALVWEDPTCHGVTRLVSHNY